MGTIQGRHLADHSAAPRRRDLEMFDLSPDPALDELTELSAVLSNADYAYIGWMDFNRLWFKSRFGFDAAEQPRTATACQWLLETGKPMLIRDAADDPRFPPVGIPLMGAKPCRSYAGVALVGPSQELIGTLAVLAREPDRFSETHITLLEVMGRQVVTRLELYERARGQEQAQRARQRAERALAMERTFVAATLDSVPALVIVLDTAGRTVRLNHSCAQVTGLSLADAVGRPFVEEILEPDDRPWASAKLREAAGGQVSGPHETAWRVVGGKSRRVSWTLRPLQGPRGEVQYLVISGQDVTDQRRAEMALRSSETRYREVVENSLGFVFTCTMEGRMTSLNAFTAETLGYRVENLTGRSVSELLDGAGLEVFHECLETLRSQEEWQGALTLRRSDGAYRRIACRGRRLQLTGERPFVLIQGTDITEQHEAQQALHVATRQRELILESVDDGIYGIDLEGRITFINQAGAKMLGHAPDNLIGRDVHEVIHHSHADGTPYSKASSPILQALRGGEPIRMRDEVFWRKDESSFPVEYSAKPLIENDQLSGMVVAFQDVSERRRLERMKDEFISTVSHELRTPLTSLRASLGLISSGALDKRPERQKQMVDIAIGNCDRLIRLVNDILDFEEIERGNLSLYLEAVEAVVLLRRAADVAMPAATQAQITIRVENTPERAMADEERVLQVLRELVSNAIKFSPPATTIRLFARAWKAPADQPAATTEQVCFTVEDQGRGIDPEKLDRIFERFQQGDASDSRALGGTGLGLALCRSIIEQHGGRLWAESRIDQGSKFHFTLPAALPMRQD